MKDYMKIIALASIFVVVPLIVNSAANDLLILQNIGSYRFITQTKDPLTKKIVQIPGYTTRNAPGIIGGADHFDLDHVDTTYETDYESDAADLGVEVQVTQHAGSDSDKWLLHEIDKSFRTSLGIPGDSYGPRLIDGQTVLEFGAGGREYRWLSGTKVIRIEYTDLQLEKAEPLEVVRAYLAKHPSTLSTMSLRQLRSEESKTKWVKDEMDRRLWLGDKWVAVIQPSDSKLREKLKSMIDSMVVFLNYREKYFGIAAKDEKIALETALFQNNISTVQAKLTEYKSWWSANKSGTITLP
jgi:hypothetical protein